MLNSGVGGEALTEPTDSLSQKGVASEENKAQGMEMVRTIGKAQHTSPLSCHDNPMQYCNPHFTGRGLGPAERK